jgi:hypothetical protein
LQDDEEEHHADQDDGVKGPWRMGCLILWVRFWMACDRWRLSSVVLHDEDMSDGGDFGLGETFDSHGFMVRFRGEENA